MVTINPGYLGIKYAFASSILLIVFPRESTFFLGLPAHITSHKEAFGLKSSPIIISQNIENPIRHLQCDGEGLMVRGWSVLI